KATQIKEELGLKGELSLVDASMLEPYNLKGSAELTFTIDDFKAIEGKVVNIKDGSKILRSFTIDQATIQLDDLPVGCYYVELPGAEEYSYTFDYTNIVVKADTKTSTEIVYQRSNSNGILSNTVFQFQGLGNKLYATLQLNPETNKIEINYRGTTPHSYIDQVYSAVTITDPQGTQLYSREIIGNVTIEEPRFEEIPYEIGTEVWIKHREASSRFVPYSNFDKQIITELKMNVNVGETYVVTPYGLMKKGMSVQEQEAIYNKVLKKYFDDFVQFIGEDKRTDVDSFYNERGKVYRALLVTEEGRRILAENIDMFVKPDKTPTVTITGGEEPIEIGRKKDLYPHLNIVDYNGNPVTSDEAHVTFTFPEPMEIDQEYTIPYEVRDDEGNTAQGEVRVILKDRSPVVTITGSEEPIKIFNKDDLYQYFDIVDYKGNKVTSDEAHVTFTFPDPMEVGTEYEVSYEVKDDEDYRTQGTVRVILQDKSPVVTITGNEEVIKVFNKDDLYQYFDIVDYKGNKVTSDADHVTFTFPEPMEVGREYEVSYEVKDDEDNTTQGTVRVILQDKSPVVTITGSEEPIKVAEKDDLYQFLNIVDYKGNKVTSDTTHVTFTFPDPMVMGKEYTIPYEVRDDEGNTAQGEVRVILQDKSPVVTITGSEEPIKILQQDDLYQYFDIVDYKGNKVAADAAHITFEFPNPMEVGKEYSVSYKVVDDEGNSVQGVVRVILRDKTPTVTILSTIEPIEIAQKDDLYQYFHIVDYKGNVVPSNDTYITFDFPEMVEGQEYEVPYTIKDTEGNRTQGTVKVIIKIKTPKVEIIGGNNPIVIEEYDDLYAYLEITDYKGNKVPSDKEHITFDFSQVSSKPGEESIVP
ncbi:MAG: hypothetical protein K2F55_02265, partial [Erysipelotrichaceae bacterium]|nr:hypothetical protein [Erysipelotrichaceae bacterium]